MSCVAARAYAHITRHRVDRARARHDQLRRGRTHIAIACVDGKRPVAIEQQRNADADTDADADALANTSATTGAVQRRRSRAGDRLAESSAFQRAADYRYRELRESPEYMVLRPVAERDGWRRGDGDTPCRHIRRRRRLSDKSEPAHRRERIDEHPHAMVQRLLVRAHGAVELQRHRRKRQDMERHRSAGAPEREIARPGRAKASRGSLSRASEASRGVDWWASRTVGCGA